MAENEDTEEIETEGQETEAADTSEEESDEQIASRKQRRANRYREALERAAAAEQRATQAQAQIAFLAGQMEEGRRAQMSREEPKDPRREKWQELSDRQRSIWAPVARLGQDAPEEMVKKAMGEIDELEWQKRNIERGQPQGQQFDERMVHAAMMRAQWPDVVSNMGALRWANGYYEQQVALGRQDLANVQRESFEAARRQFGMAGRPPPNSAERGRYMGSGRGAHGGSNEPLSDLGSDEEVVFQRAADALYPNEPDEGKRLMKYRAALRKQKKAPNSGWGT